MARRVDPDIKWRVGRLERALKAAVGKDERMDAIGLAMRHLNGDTPRITALANALLRACFVDIDTNNDAFRARALGAQRTRKLARAVESWAAALEPILADNRRHMEQLGTAARNFPAHELPDRVDNVCRVIRALDELAELLARQLYYPVSIPVAAGKPSDAVLNEITQVLFEGGCTLKEIAELTDRGAGDRLKRVRHRLGPIRGRVPQSDKLNPRAKRSAKPPKTTRR